VKDDSKFIGQSLDDCGIRRDLGIIIIAIKRASGEMVSNPTSTSVIEKGDILIALGEKEHLKAFYGMVGRG
jgi:voltage-gated potassium channel